MTEYELGILVGILIGEGHFGGDRIKAQVTLRMHVREKKLFEKLLKLIPGSKLYGPYHHSNRHYYQWMVRGRSLKKVLIPLLDKVNISEWSPHTYARYKKMKETYSL
ncbi:MAG: hypothetical protein J7L42_03435 [Elusimicrobia bacterium]|nr:hypothetical protein [Elusimicrobiota bacterium]